MINHLRRNLISYVALFLALGGTAWASGTVGSADVIDNSLRSVDLRDGAAVGSADVVDNSLTGAAIDESTLANVPNAAKLYGGFNAGDLATPTTPVGGDVSGTFPNMQLKAGVVTSAVVRDGAIGRADLSNSAAGAFGSVSSTGGLSRRSRVIDVTHPQTGVYCITASSGIDPAARGLVATPNFANDTTTRDNVNGGAGSTTVEWNSGAPHCTTGSFEVDTFEQKYFPDNAGYWANYTHDEGFSFVIR